MGELSQTVREREVWSGADDAEVRLWCLMQSSIRWPYISALGLTVFFWTQGYLVFAIIAWLIGEISFYVEYRRALVRARLNQQRNALLHAWYAEEEAAYRQAQAEPWVTLISKAVELHQATQPRDP